MTRQAALGLAVLLVLIALPALWEFHGLLRQAGQTHFAGLYLAGGPAFVALTAFGLLHARPETVADLQMCLVLLLGVAAPVAALVRPERRVFESAGATLLALAYVPLLFSYFPHLLFGWEHGDGRLLVLYMIVVVKCSDMGAFFVGSAWGRHKLFPRISPAKTWEGLAGGVAASVAASILFRWARGGDFVVLDLPAAHAVVLGVVLALSGMTGDLVDSMFKRAAGVKDSGSWIRGMGGVLDVVDSLLLAAPVMYLYVRMLA